MAEEYEIPEGMVKVPGGYQYRGKVDPIDLQRDDIVRALFQEAEELNDKLKDFKARCHKAVCEHLVAANNDEIEESDATGKMPDLLSLDGSMLLEIDQTPVIVATEQVVHLKKLLKESLKEMPDDDQELVGDIVKKLLRLDSNGAVNIDTARKLAGIKRINTPSWNEAMELLPDCTKEQGIHTRFRFKIVDEDGNKTNVLSNFSRIPVGG